MTKLPAAKPSPRIAGGVLRWYDGDTFEIVLRFDLEDQDGEAVDIGSTHSVSVEFLDDTRQSVHTFRFSEVEGNQVTLEFDEQTTAKFAKGSYVYDIRYTHGDRTTLARRNPAVVE